MCYYNYSFIDHNKKDKTIKKNIFCIQWNIKVNNMSLKSEATHIEFQSNNK